MIKSMEIRVVADARDGKIRLTPEVNRDGQWQPVFYASKNYVAASCTLRHILRSEYPFVTDDNINRITARVFKKYKKYSGELDTFVFSTSVNVRKEQQRLKKKIRQLVFAVHCLNAERCQPLDDYYATIS